MTSPNSDSHKTTRATIKELLKGRTQVAEKLADQLDKWEQTKAAVAAAQARLKTRRPPPARSIRRRWTWAGPQPS
jgi:hypothetical protein